MFIHFLISLIAVIAFAIFEYVHNKATYNFQTAWVKYVAGLLLGTFGFSYLTQFKVFQWIEQAALVIAFLFFFWVIVNALKIKGVPGQPLKMLFFLLLTGIAARAQPSSPFPGDHLVSLGEAFAHCAHAFSYWFWIIFPILFGGGTVWFIHYEGVKTNKDVDNIIKAVVILILGFVLVHIFLTPCDLAQNTLESWAQQGKWVGY